MPHDSPGNLVLDAKDVYEILMGSPSTGSPNAGGVGENCVIGPVEKSPAQTTFHREFLSIRHGPPRPRRCADGGICGVINNSGGSRNVVITIMVQLTSTRFVVPGSLLITPTALHARDS